MLQTEIFLHSFCVFFCFLLCSDAATVAVVVALQIELQVSIGKCVLSHAIEGAKRIIIWLEKTYVVISENIWTVILFRAIACTLFFSFAPRIVSSSTEIQFANRLLQYGFDMSVLGVLKETCSHIIYVRFSIFRHSLQLEIPNRVFRRSMLCVHVVLMY